MAAYSGIVEVTTYMGPTVKYGFRALADCDDGSYVGMGFPRA